MKNIVLCGMMGSGKTTMARQLGQRLGRRVIDTDAYIVERAGMTISDLFAQKGEAAFRQLETEICQKLSGKNDLVIATGGGLPLGQENRDLLKKTGIVVFLNRSPGEIYDTVDMSSRPLGQQGKDAFLARFAEREPIYRAFADIEIDNFSSPAATLEEILAKLEGQL